MVIGSKNILRQVFEPPLCINSEKIEKVDTFKYLGLMLDSELNFAADISYAYHKACSKLSLLRKTRLCMNQSVACQLYKSLILLQIEYCDVVYMGSSKSGLADLQKVQNICCSVILLAPRDAHIKETHSKLKLFPLEHRRDLHMSQLCHKAVNEDGNCSKKYFIKANIDSVRPTRHSNKMNMKLLSIKSAKAHLGIAYRGPHHWNQLLNDEKLIEKYDTSKKSIHKRILASWDNHPT